jgi:hypothetical protein
LPRRRDRTLAFLDTVEQQARRSELGLDLVTGLPAVDLGKLGEGAGEAASGEHADRALGA